jgi:hypothetical protein
VLSQPFQPIALAGLRDPGRLHAAWAVLDVELDDAERRLLETGDGG